MVTLNSMQGIRTIIDKNSQGSNLALPTSLALHFRSSLIPTYQVFGMGNGSGELLPASAKWRSTTSSAGILTGHVYVAKSIVVWDIGDAWLFWI